MRRSEDTNILVRKQNDRFLTNKKDKENGSEEGNNSGEENDNNSENNSEDQHNSGSESESDSESCSDSEEECDDSESCDCDDPNCEREECNHTPCTFTFSETNNINLNIPASSGPDINYNHPFTCPPGSTYDVEINFDTLTSDGTCNLVIEELPNNYQDLSEIIPMYSGVYNQATSGGNITVQVTPTLSDSIWLYSCYGSMSTYPRNLTVTEQ